MKTILIIVLILGILIFSLTAFNSFKILKIESELKDIQWEIDFNISSIIDNIDSELSYVKDDIEFIKDEVDELNYIKDQVDNIWNEIIYK